ncbi:MAG: hypothetical protein HQ509_10285 [Candidatus Marinimicrobia bacterium]|nr:hypothetical protein [Candidatus Neomarinimicrobiota bacterium]
MILPTKHISQHRSLIGQGGKIIQALQMREHTVSSLWDTIQHDAIDQEAVTFDWYILSLDLLFAIKVIELEEGIIKTASTN